MTSSLLIVAALWLGYGALHSVLASRPVKAWIDRVTPGLTRWYRGLYNTVAVVTLVPMIVLPSRLETVELWTWSGPLQWVQIAIAVMVAFGFLVSLRGYDMLSFLGVKAFAAEPSLTTTGLNAWVRHPWYSLALVFIWTRDMNSVFLVQAVVITLYIAVGYRFEERRLTDEFGPAYDDYRQRVSALIPIPARLFHKS